MNVLISKFTDKKSSGKKNIYIIDTKYTAELSDTHRIVRGGKRILIQKSLSMNMYNKCMGGVDRTDQMLHSYDASRKSYRWFLKVGVHFLQRLCLNAHIVYSTYGGKSNFEKFTINCARYLLCETGIGRRPLNDNVPPSLNKSHLVSRFPERGNNLRPTKRCRLCYSQGKIKKTTTYCTGCPGEPGLCISPCFVNFHQS